VRRAGRLTAGGLVPGRLRFVFYGRVSTEDWQDPVTSRARQRARDHLCGTFQTSDQLLRSMDAFFRAGLVAGGTCMIAPGTAEPDGFLAVIGSAAEIASLGEGWPPDRAYSPSPEEARQDLTFQQILDVWNELIEMARFGRVRLGEAR